MSAGEWEADGAPHGQWPVGTVLPAGGSGSIAAAQPTAPPRAASRRAPAPHRGHHPTPAPGSGTADWTAEEVAAVEAALHADVERLREELDVAQADIAGLIADSGDGAGDDQADAGSKTFEREHEMSVSANTRDMLEQTLHALARLADGSYGSCESCGLPIRKGRLQAFPRATLCISCKQAEERR